MNVTCPECQSSEVVVFFDGPPAAYQCIECGCIFDGEE